MCFSEAQNNKAKDIRYRVQVQELASESPDWNDSRAMFTEKVATNLKLTNRANVFLAKVKMQLNARLPNHLMQQMLILG